MARMFCTLKEAAAWLNTTEPQLKTMLAEGILPEFQKGPHRLVRVSDVRALAIARSQNNRERQVPEPVRDSMSIAGSATEACEPDIRLPRTGTCLLGASARPSETPERPDENEPAFAPTPRPTPSVVHPVEIWHEPGENRETQIEALEEEWPSLRTDTYSAMRLWARSHQEKPTVRKGLWMGVVDDCPWAILTVSALVAGSAAALAAGVYALVRFLG